MSESKLKKAPLFICGCPKSGTTLVRSLFDGHPELLVFPIEMKFFRHTDYPTLFPQKKLNQESDVKKIVAKMLESRAFKTFLRKEALTFPANEKQPDYHVDPAKFESFFSDLSEVNNLRKLFIHFFKALLVATDRPVSHLYQYTIVNKTPFQEENAHFLKQWFPNARFIHMVRNPYANFVSLRKRRERSGKPLSSTYLQTISDWLRFSHYFRERNQRFMSVEDYMVLCYEDLVQTPEQTMRQAAAFAQIEFQDSLLRPTQQGQLWPGNSMFDQLFRSIDSSPVERWKSHITDVEVTLVNQTLKNVFDALDYPMK